MDIEKEKQLTRECIGMALRQGASAARASLSISTMDLVATLNGEVDRVTGCRDRSISLSIFADGRYGSFSTNKLERAALEEFIARAVKTVKMLEPDQFRTLPDPERTAKNAVDGNELGIYDDAYTLVDAETRRKTALGAGAHTKEGKGWKLISEEGEYSDSEYYNYVVDSRGTECFHRETSFEFGVEATIQDGSGNKYSGYWWEASPVLSLFDARDCTDAAIRQAVEQMHPKTVKSGKYAMIVDREVASKFVSPVLAALNAFSIQQQNSFLSGSEGRKIFSDRMTLTDMPHIKGQTGSRLFDSEGVATKEAPIIENGVVKHYFVNTYMSGKLGIEPTNEEATRPVLSHIGPASDCDGLMQLCPEGIMVTDFNGGNSNSATGNFSYGIQGFYFKDGVRVHPVSGMLVTGNLVTLWNNLVAVADDARPCASKLIPSLLFNEVDFSGQ